MDMSSANIASFDHAEDQKITGLQGRFEKAAAQGDHESIEKAAKQFEAYMLSNLFKTMYSGVEKSELSGNSFAQDTFMGMFIDECTSQGSLGSQGIAAQIMKKYDAHQVAHTTKTLRSLENTATDPTIPFNDAIVATATEQQLMSRDELIQSLVTMTNQLEESVSSDFGLRTHPIEHIKKFHAGIDYALPHGEPVKVPAAGTVSFAGNDGGYGKTVIVDHGHGLKTVYAHLSQVDVKVGEYLNKSEPLGKIGSTGISTGPHLHFEVRENNKPIDPLSLEISDQKMAKE